MYKRQLLEVSKKDLKDGDTFKVSIVSKALRVLSSSNEYVYQEKSESIAIRIELTGKAEQWQQNMPFSLQSLLCLVQVF